MTYDELAAIFLVPADVAPPAPAVPDTPARRLRDAVEPIATIGWWSRAATEGFERLGIDFFGGYVWGRSASLGADVEAAVVVSAFGCFEPSMLTAVLDGARSAVPRAAVLAERERGATEGLRAAAGDVDVELVASASARLRSALDPADGAARPFFGGLRALPVPDDPFGALWRAAEMYREHRGDGHLAACVAAGLDVVEMNVLTEVWLGYPVGEYSSTRGFAPERLDEAVTTLTARGWMESGELTDAGRGARDAVEAWTDLSQLGVIDVLGDDLDALVADLGVVSDAVLAAHAAPADPRKRAAG